MFNLIQNSKLLLFLVNLILGAILVYSYHHYIKYGGVSVKALWGDGYDYKQFFYLTMLLALLGYLAILVYAFFFAEQNKTLLNLCFTQILIIAISMLWLPLTIKFLKTKGEVNKKLLTSCVIVVLFLVALASIKQYLVVEKLNPKIKNNVSKSMKKLALVGAGLFILQTFAMDFLAWDVGFFVSNNNL